MSRSAGHCMTMGTASTMACVTEGLGLTLTGGAASSVNCQWDSETVITSCTSPQGPKTLAAGPHTFKVTASNVGGTATLVADASSTPATTTLTIDDGATAGDGAASVADLRTVSGIGDPT